MIKEIKLIFVEDKNKNHNIMQNTVSSIKSERKNSQTDLLGKKRKNSNDQKVLLISKPKTHCINRKNIDDISNCPICLQKIYLRDKNTCFLGHIFHCDCINKWIKSGKKECPFCRLKIDCPLHPKNRAKELDKTINNNNNSSYNYISEILTNRNTIINKS